MHKALQARGVKFKFFHKVKNLGLGADGASIASIDIDVQAREVRVCGRVVSLTRIEFDELLVKIRRLLAHKKLVLENQYLRKELKRDFNFSQMISDNVEEALSGVKAENSIKVVGPDLRTNEKKADEIVDAALVILRDQGLDAVSMRTVSAALGVSPVPLYRRVGNKDDLLGAVAQLVLLARQTVQLPPPLLVREARLVARELLLAPHQFVLPPRQLLDAVDSGLVAVLGLFSARLVLVVGLLVLRQLLVEQARQVLRRAVLSVALPRTLLLNLPLLHVGLRLEQRVQRLHLVRHRTGGPKRVEFAHGRAHRPRCGGHRIFLGHSLAHARRSGRTAARVGAAPPAFATPSSPAVASRKLRRLLLASGPPLDELSAPLRASPSLAPRTAA